MKKNEELFEVAKKDEEELLDFEFDELSEEDLEAASDDSVLDEEIIELDDIVETGEFAEGSESEEITKVLDEEMMKEKAESAEAEFNAASSELDQTPEPDTDDSLATMDSTEMDISDTGHMAKRSESEEIATLLDGDESTEAPEPTEVISDLGIRDSDKSDDLAADIEAEFEGLDTSEGDVLESAKFDEDSEFEETLRLPEEEEVIEKASSPEAESDLTVSDLDEPLETDASKDLSAALEAEFEGLETSEIDMLESEEPVQGAEADEISRLLQAEDAFEDQVSTEEEADLTSDEMEQPKGSDSSQVVEMQLDAALESLEASEKTDSEFEFLESDTGSVSEPESLDESMFESEGLEESEISEDLSLEEAEAEVPPILPHDDLSEGLETPDEQLAGEDMMAAPAAAGAIAISEERIEEIITSVVEDVVERVGRETMANVAEKLITEAIDALKESLESVQD
jgi:hypothetical protein